MVLANADIKRKLSTKTGAAGNSTAAVPADSLGKYISTTEIVDNNLHNLFDVVSGAENVASESEYRCIFFHNNHATITLENAKVYIAAQVAGGAAVEIGVDPTAASAIGAAPAQAVSIANEDTAPAGVAFSAPADSASALAVGNIAPGQCKAVWIKRTTANNAALANDGFTLRLIGESL